MEVLTQLTRATLGNTPRFKLLAGWCGPARVLDVYDGDTLTAALEYPAGQVSAFQVRIAGIDAPELRGNPTPTAGIDARDRLIELLLSRDFEDLRRAQSRKQVRALFEATPVIVDLEALGPEKYGRVLSRVFAQSCGKRVDVGEAMRAMGAAVAYDGGHKSQIVQIGTTDWSP